MLMVIGHRCSFKRPKMVILHTLAWLNSYWLYNCTTDKLIGHLLLYYRCKVSCGKVMFSQVFVHRGVVVMPGSKWLLERWVSLVPGPFQGVSPVPGLFWGYVYGLVGVLRVYRGWATGRRWIYQRVGEYTMGWVGIPGSGYTRYIPSAYI